MKKRFTLFLSLLSLTMRAEIFVTTGIQLPKEQLRFATVDGAGNTNQDLLLDPNPKKNLNISVHHPKLSISAGLPIVDRDEKAKGNSQVLDFRFKSKFGDILPDFYFLKYKGFEIKDELDGQRSLGFLTNVETLHFGGNLTYFTEKNFNSLPSGHAFYKDWQEARPEKEVNTSWTLSAGIDHLKVYGLPDQQRALSQLRGNSDFQTLSFRGGGVLQYFRKAFVFEGTFAAGPGLMRSETQNTLENYSFVINANIGFFVGVKVRDDLFLSLLGDIQAINGQVESTQFSNNLVNIEVALGKSF